jgi:ATP-dependent helicase HrpA
MYIDMGGRQDLIEDIIMASIFDCFLSESLPEQKSEFDAVVRDNKPEFISTANRMAELVHKVLRLHREVRARLQHSNMSRNHLDDCREQCEYLVYPGFVRDIQPRSLIRLPVYFQAMLKRLDKMEQDPKQADRTLPVIRELWQQYLELEARSEGATGGTAEKLQQLRWMIEEFRISCFAQPIKTRGPVSENKIRKLLNDIQ